MFAKFYDDIILPGIGGVIPNHKYTYGGIVEDINTWVEAFDRSFGITDRPSEDSSHVWGKAKWMKTSDDMYYGTAVRNADPLTNLGILGHEEAHIIDMVGAESSLDEILSNVCDISRTLEKIRGHENPEELYAHMGAFYALHRRGYYPSQRYLGLDWALEAYEIWQENLKELPSGERKITKFESLGLGIEIPLIADFQGTCQRGKNKVLIRYKLSDEGEHFAYEISAKGTADAIFMQGYAESLVLSHVGRFPYISLTGLDQGIDPSSFSYEPLMITSQDPLLKHLGNIGGLVALLNNGFDIEDIDQISIAGRDELIEWYGNAIAHFTMTTPGP